MTTKKIILVTLAILACITGVRAQGCQSIIRELGSSDGAVIRVEMDRASTSAMEFRRGTSTVAGYRICLFSGTDQNARSRANEAIARLKDLYPMIDSKWLYDAPVFKVHCGAWLTRIEATVMLSKLKSSFPSAFIIGDKVGLNELLSKLQEHSYTEGEMDDQAALGS